MLTIPEDDQHPDKHRFVGARRYQDENLAA